MPFDVRLAPVTLAWETTRACPLRCLHCRAVAQPHRDPRELSTEEGLDLIGQAAALGTRVFVVTGGDPLARPDVYDLLRAAAATPMHVGFSPSVTARLTADRLAAAVDAGVGTVHLSLDGGCAETHDGFRGVRGSFRRTLAAIDTAHALPVRLQVATTVSRRTVDDLPAIAELLAGRVDSWTLFFLVPTGRADAADRLAPQEQERVLGWLSGLEAPPVRTVEAPAFRRVLAQRGRPTGPAITDGSGFCFVSHTGDVSPSGFLPLVVGNVRDVPLAELYRDAPLLRALRDPSRRGGKCGSCEFLSICGGSRAHAFAATGDPLAADPTCPYVPASMKTG